MQIFLLSILLLTFSGTLADDSQCSQNTFFIQNDNQEHSNCENSIILTKNEIPNYPTSGTRQLTFVISTAQSSECDGVTRLPIFGITIKPDGNSGVERQIVEFRSPQGTELINPMDVYTTDKSGIPQLVSAEPFDLDDWNRIVVSIDLERNLFSTQFLSELGITSNVLTTLNYGDWSFDDTITIYLGQSNSAGRPAAKMIWRSFALDYAYYPKTKLYSFLFQAVDVSPRGFYAPQEENKSDINDISGINATKSFGTLYASQSTSSTTGSATVPASSELGVSFTKTDQYLTFKSSVPSIASEGHFYLLPASFTISFWVKLTEQPVETQYLLRKSTVEGSDIFALKVNTAGKVIAIIADTVITTTMDSLVVGEWTSVTAFFVVTIANLNKEATAIINFWDKPQTPAASQTLSSIATEFKESPNDDFKIGGFKGVINNLQFYSPGAPLVNSPSCSSNSDCRLSLGYDYSQCLVTSCPKGTYDDGTSCQSCDSSCQTCTGSGPSACDSCELPATLSGTTCFGSSISEKVGGEVPGSIDKGIENEVQTKNNGLSRGVIVAIVIGSIAVVGVLGYILKKTVFIRIMTKLRANDAPSKKVRPEPMSPTSPTENQLFATQNPTLTTENIALESDREMQSP